MENNKKISLFERVRATYIYVAKLDMFEQMTFPLLVQPDIDSEVKIGFFASIFEYLIVKASVLFQNNQICSLEFFSKKYDGFDKEYRDFRTNNDEILKLGKNARDKMIAHYEKETNFREIALTKISMLIKDLVSLTVHLLYFVELTNDEKEEIEKEATKLYNSFSPYKLQFIKGKLIKSNSSYNYGYSYENRIKYFFFEKKYFNAYDFGKEKDTNITLSSTDNSKK